MQGCVILLMLKLKWSIEMGILIEGYDMRMQGLVLSSSCSFRR